MWWIRYRMAWIRRKRLHTAILFERKCTQIQSWAYIPDVPPCLGVVGIPVPISAFWTPSSLRQCNRNATRTYLYSRRWCWGATMTANTCVKAALAKESERALVTPTQRCLAQQKRTSRFTRSSRRVLRSLALHYYKGRQCQDSECIMISYYESLTLLFGCSLQLVPCFFKHRLHPGIQPSILIQKPLPTRKDNST